MSFRLVVLVYILSIPFFLQASQFSYPVGARSGALGNTSVTYSDVWSSFNNQAGLGFVKNICAGVNYENRFLIPELGLKSVAAVFPHKRTTFGLSASTFGYNIYSENKYGLAIAKLFGDKFSAGVQLDYLKNRIAEGYSNKGIITAEFGIMLRPTNDFTFAAHVFNPVRVKLNNYNDERVATIMKAGVSYMFSEKVLIVTEVSKNNNEHVQFRAGMEYSVLKELFLRVGIGTNPSTINFGVGFILRKFKIDLSSSHHQLLGYTPQVTIIYNVKYE